MLRWPDVGFERAGIVALVGQSEPPGLAQHMRMKLQVNVGLGSAPAGVNRDGDYLTDATWRSALAPESTLRVSEWADRHRILPLTSGPSRVFALATSFMFRCLEQVFYSPDPLNIS
jgi:hypothetical protein